MSWDKVCDWLKAYKVIPHLMGKFVYDDLPDPLKKRYMNYDWDSCRPSEHEYGLEYGINKYLGTVWSVNYEMLIKLGWKNEAAEREATRLKNDHWHVITQPTFCVADEGPLLPKFKGRKKIDDENRPEPEYEDLDPTIYKFKGRKLIKPQNNGPN